MKGKRWPVVLGLFLIFIGLPLFLAWNFLLGPVMDTTQRYRSLVGKTESEVIAELGPPKYRVSPNEAKSLGIDNPWKKMHYLPVPERTVHKIVLLYQASDRGPFGVYIFIGDDDRVEGIDFAGT